MKKFLLLILLFLIINCSCYGQTRPLAVYSSNKMWKSTPTDDGHGFISFKFGNVINLDKSYFFSIYKDHITIKYQEALTFYIDKIQDNFTNATKYDVHNQKGQYFEITLRNSVSDNHHYFRLDFSQMNKAKKNISLTVYDLK